MICTECKGIQDFYRPDLDAIEAPEETQGWGIVEGRHFELRGMCQKRLEKKKKKKRQSRRGTSFLDKIKNYH